MNLKKLRLKVDDSRVKIIDSYSSLDVPIVKKASFCNLMLIGGTAVQLLARAYGVKELRKRSINDLDFLTSARNKRGIEDFKDALKSQGFVPFKMGESDYMLNYENKDVGVEVDVLISWEPDVMERAVTVKGILVQDPCWQFLQKVQRIAGGLSTKSETDTQDLYVLYDVIEKRKDIEKLEELLSEEVSRDSTVEKVISELFEVK